MEKTYIFEPKTIKEKFDVVVVGGGLTGVMSAISASREGKKVALIEKYGFLGGMATSGLVTPFMYYVENGSEKVANAGLFTTLLRKMREFGAITEQGLTARWVDFNEQLLRIALDDMILASGVKVIFHAYMSDVKKTGDRIDGITISTVSGNVEIYGDIFIDATGNGDLFAYLKLPYFLLQGPTEYSQPMTTCFNLCDVDWSKFNKAEVNKLYAEFQSQGKIKNPRGNILSMTYPVPHVMHFNTTRIINKNPCDVEDLTDAEFMGREQVYEMYNFLKDNVEAFKDSQLINLATEVGVRESRRFVGEYVITKEDIINTAKFKDSICRGTYEIDIHHNSGGATIIPIKDNDYYTVPYRSMVSKNCENLIVAGRCISCEHVAQAAIRIMPITSCMGEAAGIAAAIACQEKTPTYKVNAQKIQQKLTKYNALY